MLSKTTLSIAGVFISGLVIGVVASSSDESHEPVIPSQSGNDQPAGANRGLPLEFTVSQLHKALEEEIEQRRALSAQVNELSRLITKMNASSDDVEELTLNETQRTGVATVSSLQSDANPEERQKEIFSSLGLGNDAIQRINKRKEQREMDELYLRNQAVREGWYQTERYVTERRNLNGTDVYREELGDSLYDQYLYESGLPNRVEVDSVLNGSPAEKAGILAGDTVFSYDGQRIYRWTELTSETSKGDPGQTVKVQVLRDGQLVDVYLNRGPLGIRLGASRVEPGNS